MPRTAQYSKSAIADRLETVFEKNGYEGASLKLLAEAAGLSKASLYHHFPGGKQEMAGQVLIGAGLAMQKFILAPLARNAPAQARLQASLTGTATYYGGSVPVCLMNSLLLGEGLTLFGAQIARAVVVWREGLEKAYAEVGADRSEAEAWAAYAVERIQGALVLCRVQQSRKPLETCLVELSADVDMLAG